MAVEFILGRSGSGKTSRCIGSIVDELTGGSSDAPLVLLVPEQATYQSERAILNAGGICGFNRLKVISFNRLEFMLSGSKAAGKDISRLGREMVIGRILKRCRGDLQVFKNSALTHGLAEELTSTIIELHECDKGPADLAVLIENLKQKNSDPLLAMKLTDILLIFQEYLEFLEGNFVNPDIALTDARQKVADAEFLQGARLWVDGFASFTVQQQFLLAEMMQVSQSSHIALCLDPGRIDIDNPEYGKLNSSSIFNLTERTYVMLVEMIRAFKFQINKPVILDKTYRFKNAGAIDHLERNIFELNPQSFLEDDQSIKLAFASNRRAEVDHAARQIISLIRKKKYRFRDIAVIVSDVPAYQHYIDAAFKDFGIEFFLDRPKPMAQHPVVELITSAISIACDGFSTSNIFSYLKTNLGCADRHQTDLLENYCLAYGIDGHLWTSAKPWSFSAKVSGPYDEKSIDKLRNQIVKPLEKFKDKINPGQLIIPAQFAAAVYGLLKELNVFNKIADWAEASDETDRLEQAQFFEKLAEIFDEIVDIFGDEQMSAEEIATILQNTFSKFTLKLIPQKLDQVLVGSIDRSRHPELKAVFLIGATQKQFPSQVSIDNILTDGDRQTAVENDFYLSERLCDQLLARQYLAYIAFTRPSEYLYVSCPMSDDEGRQIVPSTFLDNLCSLFVDFKAEKIADGSSDIENVICRNELADLLCENLGSSSTKKDVQLAALAECLCEDQELGDIGEIAASSLGYDNAASVDDHKWPEIQNQLIGDQLRCSASRLKSFAACPYQHFAKYILRLKARELMGFEPMDLGSFYHSVLEGVFKELKERGRDFATAEACELKAVCGKVIEKTLDEDMTISIFVKKGLHNKFLIDSACDVLLDCVCDYGRLSRAGTFRQKAAEVSFGFDDSLQELAIAAPNGKQVLLRGVIDRVDIAEIDGRRAALVFDYKRRETSVSWEKMYHGLDTQLVLYMLAAGQIEFDGKKPDFIAGAFYLPVESNTGIQKDKFPRKARGIYNGDHCASLQANAAGGWNRYYNFYLGKDSQYSNYVNSALLRPAEFQLLLSFIKKRVAFLAGEIFSGNIHISPYRLGKEIPCDYCDYRSLCRFDVHINEFRDFSSMKKDRLISIIGGTDDS